MNWSVILEMVVGIVLIIIMVVGILMFCTPSIFVKKEDKFDDRKVFRAKRIGAIIAILTGAILFFTL